MVQLMSSEAESETTCCKKVPVKSEVDDLLGKQLGPVHKRSKLDPSHPQWNPESADLWIPPWEYNPLDEPSPLGLRLKKSPSFLDLIQMKLSQTKKNHKATAVSGGITDKLKASNFAVSLLRIGTWEYKSRYEGDLVAKCYFAKHKLVWEVLDGGLKNKIEIQWSDIVALKASYPEDGPETLDIVLARQPLFFRETNPQPRKHTLWQATSDFTGGEASAHRRHFLQCPQGLLGRHFEKLIQCDPRLNFLSQQPDIMLESPYFEPRVSVFDDPNKSSHGFDLKSDDGSAFFDLREAASPSGAQLSSLKNKQEDFVGRAHGNSSREIPSPSSVIDTHAIEEFRTIGAKEPKFLSQLDQIKVPGFHPSMSMSDLVIHIGHCISGQMTSGNPIFSSDDIKNRDILEEITQYLFSDPQSTSASDEHSLMSRVNSLCCLLQKDPATVHTLQAQSDDGPDGHGDRRAGETIPLSALACETKVAGDISAPQCEFNDVSGCKKGPTMSRKDSVGELFLNLPRIASLPQFLYNIWEDSDNQAR